MRKILTIPRRSDARTSHLRVDVTSASPQARRALYTLLFLLLGGVVALGLSGCGNPFGCGLFNPDACSSGGGGGASPGYGCNGAGQHLWDCNGDSALGMPLPGYAPPPPGTCGVYVCAADVSGAKQQLAQAAGVSPDVSGLSCISMGTTVWSFLSASKMTNDTFNAPGAVCIHQEGPGCNPCDDGQGDMLAGPGEPCTGDDSNPSSVFNNCCHGLQCAGASASIMGTCVGTPVCPQPQTPNLVPLTTTRLRQIAIQNNINNCANQTGITQSRTIGLAFETWVLFMRPQMKNTDLYMSQARKLANNGGLPASVIPDYVTDLALFVSGSKVLSPFPKSMFGEVKAVTGTLTSSSNRSQILGLIDVTSQSPAGTSPIPNHMPPALVFTTTGNTTLGSDVSTNGTQYGVGIWQQLVYVDATNPNDPNPDLYLWDTVCLNPMIYGVSSAQPLTRSGAHSKLTAPTMQLTPIPGDPDPPEVD
jgi:hypothetical protein